MWIKWIRGLDWCLLLAYCCLIFWLSSKEVLPVPMLFPHQDKLFHFTAYSVMGILAMRVAGQRHAWANLKPVQMAIVFCALYGVSDEVHQYYVEGRSTDFIDWCADLFGASFGAWGMLKLSAAWKARQR